jgi:prepilin-type N-terminal cleavage/methylation domain-containing protein
MKRTVAKGFTIVELIVVIVVLSILVMITASIYQSAQVQARDARNVDGMDKFADAVSLFTAKNYHFPRGGNSSTVAIGSGTECADGINGWAAYGYLCDVEDTLVASGYLPSGFTNSLSPNVNYSPNETNGAKSLMVYRASVSGTPPVEKWFVMTSMEAPTTDDTAHFNAEMTKCYGSVLGSYSPRDTYGMRNGICLTLQTF